MQFFITNNLREMNASELVESNSFSHKPVVLQIHQSPQ
jgi:hypothetical protein